MVAPDAPSTPGLAPGPSTKRLSTIKSSGAGSANASPVQKKAGGVAVAPKNVVSPGELCGFVDTLLSQLETRFDEMSDQVLQRMNDMSSRIDQLENTIQDLMHGDIDQPSAVMSPTPMTPAPKK